MKAIACVLDTSAILVHFFGEPGADVVERVWAAGSALPGISAVTAAELRLRLGREVSEDPAAQEAIHCYLNELTICLPVDRAIAECAWQLKISASPRIPLIDAIIAATARSVGATLIHRDPHMSSIPEGLLAQVQLPR